MVWNTLKSCSSKITWSMTYIPLFCLFAMKYKLTALKNQSNTWLALTPRLWLTVVPIQQLSTSKPKHSSTSNQQSIRCRSMAMTKCVSKCFEAPLGIQMPLTPWHTFKFSLVSYKEYKFQPCQIHLAPILTDEVCLCRWSPTISLNTSNRWYLQNGTVKPPCLQQGVK